ncbi:MAG: type II secretion system secretin GspD [Synergistales bacterium]|nr:type II secretion system secretin GspD [Synergistales bacterium]MDY6401541.1 type II secretion system secretin GspD [Synergistales bacterium]MDY6404219.1 type II secretion system secretin GspD [Synergistales bacterium]MDY6421543.1 type II secretion system secretin GspD [Synergistales bacterium]MDY6425008.1 type II secretion system secretin GspD [Synergistales bacterium]
MNFSFKKVSFTLIFIMTITQCSEAATRRASRNANNTAAASSASNSNANMTAEDEKNLMQAAQAMKRSGLVQFNFKDMDLVRFVRFMSEILDENIIVPPNVNAKITIISPHPVTVRESREVMLSTLQMYNFSLQNMGSYSIVRQGGVSPSPNVYRGRTGPGFGEETVTYIVPLDYVSVESVLPALQQSLGQAIIALPVGNGRDIMLQGRATDVNKGIQLLRKMDTPNSARISRTFELVYGDPATVAAQLNAIAQTSGPLQGLNAIADVPSKKIILVGSRSAIDHAARMIKELDVDSKIGDFHIYKLKNIDATVASEQVAKVLASTATMLGSDAAKFPATVVPDVATNSLIFAATQRQFDSLVPILDAIDIQPRQILLRGFIAEINVTNLENNGIDWSIIGGQMWDDLLLGGNVSLGESAVPSQFMSWFNELSKREELLDRNGSTYSITNYNPMGLMYATIDLLRRYNAVNILSVPRLMCTDNKESSFQVGQVIPVLKGSTSDLSNPSAIQNNFDYKDTGLTLTVTPHIRSGNLVAMDIKQTTEDVMSAAGDPTPRTSKREVNTSVVVGDGETIILGGMIKETERNLKRRVPGLSYIPLIGSLFQKISKEKEKVDFVIFLTPQIIENQDQMRAVTVNAAGFSNKFDLRTNKDVSVDVDISEVEADIDSRFREMYQKSLRRK